MSGPPEFPSGLKRPDMTPENIESALIALLALSRMILGEAKVREIVTRAMGDKPKVEMGR